MGCLTDIGNMEVEARSSGEGVRPLKKKIPLFRGGGKGEKETQSNSILITRSVN